MKPTTPRLDLNPSAADRWTTCTASPHFIRDNADRLPPSGTRFSEEGTTAHAVAAALLQEQPEPTDMPTPIDTDMRWHGWNYAEYVTDLRAPQSMLLVEQKLELWYMPGRHAIVDATVINPLNLHIIDLKYGEGVAVHPEGNLQAVIYAMSVAKGHNLAHDFPVFIHIYQPRGRNAIDGAAHVWETTWGEVLAISKGISEVAVLIQGADATDRKHLVFAPSEKACQWCPAKGFCEARRASLLDGIEALAVIEDPPKASMLMANQLSVEQRAIIEKNGDSIIKWIKDVQEYNLEKMMHGEKLPGHKLVLSRGGNRFWTDPKKAAELLLAETHLRREEVIEEKTIGPAAAEKLLGKRKFSGELLNLIGKPPGSPQIAPEDDKREAIAVDALSDFEPVTEQP